MPSKSELSASESVFGESSGFAAIPAYARRPHPYPPPASRFVAPLLLLGAVALLGTAYAFSIPFRQAVTYGIGRVMPLQPANESAKPAGKGEASDDTAPPSVTVVFKQPAATPVSVAPPPQPKAAAALPAKPVNKPVPVPEKLQRDLAVKTPAVVEPRPQPAQQVITAAITPAPVPPAAKPALAVPVVPLKPSVAVLPPNPPQPAKTVVTPAAHSVARIPSAILDSAPKLPVRVLAEADAPAQAAPKTQGETFSDCAQCPELVAVVASREEGLVRLASTSSPAQPIMPFAVGAREVTFDEWDRCVAEGGCAKHPSDNGWGRGQRPVINVSFEEITGQFLPWLSRVSQHHYRLPTEAEWEFAVRGASDRVELAYSFGNDAALLCDYGNASDASAKTACQDGFPTTAPVASFRPNALGLYDMHGNVWEWMSDCLRSGFSQDPAKNPEDCRFRVLRGGSWASAADALKSSERGWEKPAKAKNSIGFRIARSLP